MVKRVLLVVAVLLLSGTAYYTYQRHRAENRYNNGEISSEDLNGTAPASASDDAGNTRTPSRAGASARRVPAAPAVTDTAPNSMLPGSPGLPPTDSIAPNPANGAAFAGTGRYQVYRQGNLTWRVNTDDGTTCILFATTEEWRKPIVYSHGCRNS